VLAHVNDGPRNSASRCPCHVVSTYLAMLDLTFQDSMLTTEWIGGVNHWKIASVRPSISCDRTFRTPDDVSVRSC
jgi:hypothetical protein